MTFTVIHGDKRPPKVDRDADITAETGFLTLGSATQIRMLESDTYSGFQNFLSPLYAALNWLGDGRYDQVIMSGVSGGGWMATVYPAIDPRVTFSAAVAGSFPMYLRMLPTENVFRDIGDWEQTYPPFYNIANYFELYLMSALGTGRHHKLVYNAADPCCFSGVRAQLFLPHVEAKAETLGIRLTSFVDHDTKEHDMSEKALEIILTDIAPQMNGK